MSDLLLDRLLDVPRDRSAVSAVRDTRTGAWAHLTWDELRAAVRKAAGEAGERGARRTWVGRGASQLIGDLALQFAGVVGTLGEGEPLTAGRDDPGRLVRMRQETRPRDAAVVVGGRTLDHGEVAALAERAAKRLCPTPGLLPEVILSTVDAETDQVLGWAAVWGGLTLVTTEPGRRESVDPSVWVCTPGQLSVANLKGCGTVQRLRGDGPRLRRVFVVGTVPDVRIEGIEVSPWTL